MGSINRYGSYLYTVEFQICFWSIIKSWTYSFTASLSEKKSIENKVLPKTLSDAVTTLAAMLGRKLQIDEQESFGCRCGGSLVMNPFVRYMTLANWSRFISYELLLQNTSVFKAFFYFGRIQRSVYSFKVTHHMTKHWRRNF